MKNSPVSPKARLFTEKDAIAINRERKRLLNLLSGRVCYSFNGNKIHYGALSPGCVACAKGTWSCIYIHNKCNTDCFFCPRKKNTTNRNLAKTEGGILFGPDDYADYIDKFGFKGIGFSGGEPLLLFDKLVRYIENVRRKNGNDVYIWMYSNGKLADIEKLKKLKEAGLNEIRFNISARNYDLTPVRMAKGIIDKVTVEMPAIPEDYETVKIVLRKLCKIGVDFLNLHQLETYTGNYKNFVKRNYALLPVPHSPVFASEVTALKLLRHAADKKIKLPINYCSCAYKYNIQLKGRRKRFSQWLKGRFYDITDFGYVRSFYITGSKKELKDIVALFRKNNYSDDLWLLAKDNKRLFINHNLLRCVPDNAANLNIMYYYPVVTSRPSRDIISQAVTLNSRKKIIVKRKVALNFIKISPLARKTFVKIFLNKEDFSSSMKYFYRNYIISSANDVKKMNAENNAFLVLRQFEHTGLGFPAVKPHQFSLYE